MLHHEVPAGGSTPNSRSCPASNTGTRRRGVTRSSTNAVCPSLVDGAVHGHREHEERRRLHEQLVVDLTAEHELERGRRAEGLFDELGVRPEVRGGILCRRRVDHRPEERQVRLGEVFEICGSGIHPPNMHDRRRHRGHADDIPVTSRSPGLACAGRDAADTQGRRRRLPRRLPSRAARAGGDVRIAVASVGRLLVTVCLALFLIAVNTTAINTAVSAIADDLTISSTTLGGRSTPTSSRSPRSWSWAGSSATCSAVSASSSSESPRTRSQRSSWRARARRRSSSAGADSRGPAPPS